MNLRNVHRYWVKTKRILCNYSNFKITSNYEFTLKDSRAVLKQVGIRINWGLY